MPERIQLSRRKGWRKPENTVVVARPSRWGNPFPIDQWGRDQAIRLFRDAARGIWNPSTLSEALNDGDFVVAHGQATAWMKRLGRHPLELIRSELAGKNLGCWCSPGEPCHADVLIELANS